MGRSPTTSSLKLQDGIVPLLDIAVPQKRHSDMRGSKKSWGQIHQANSVIATVYQPNGPAEVQC